MHNVDVAIVGAGPYGLSIAAHLGASGVPFKIFGSTMKTWSDHMPAGMLLKSDGFASNLSDPGSTFTLRHFCEQAHLPYDDTQQPVALSTFVSYGRAFQQRFAPSLDPRHVVGISRNGDGFLVRLEDGESLSARRVVLAVGITHFAYVPANLRLLPAEFLTHSSDHKDPACLKNKAVTVVGGGASAIDLAALLHENGANVTVIARRSAIRFHTPPGRYPRPLWQRMRYPSSGLGPSWKSRFCTDVPGLLRHFPDELRLKIVREHLGPAPGWPMKARVEGKIPMRLGTTHLQASRVNGKVRLTFRDREDRDSEQLADHVIAATGYRADVQRLAFLDAEIQKQLKTVDGAPRLSSNFQSSVPGLYFTGIAAANTFGPLMRFAFGSAYTAHRVSAHLTKTRT